MRDMAADPSRIMKDQVAGKVYGQELRRLQQQGILGSGVIVSVTPTGEVEVAGVDWATIEVSVTVPGRDRYIAVERHMVPRHRGHVRSRHSPQHRRRPDQPEPLRLRIGRDARPPART